MSRFNERCEGVRRRAEAVSMLLLELDEDISNLGDGWGMEISDVQVLVVKDREVVYPHGAFEQRAARKEI